MARSHHRKKHKEHLKQFRDHSETAGKSTRGSTVVTLTIAGILAGLGIGYIATEGNLIWMGAGMVVMGIAGYFLGHKIDGDLGEK